MKSVMEDFSLNPSNLIESHTLTLLGQDGVIHFDNRRAMVFQHNAFLNLRSTLIQQLGLEVANSIFFRFGNKNARDDFKESEKNHKFDNETDLLLLGPKLHTGMGFTKVETEHLHFDRHKGEFLFKGKWHRSFEAEAHLKDYGLSKHPVCFSLCGYGSGWCSSFFGSTVLEIETQCMAQGHSHCEWEIRPISEWTDVAKPWIKAASYGTQSIYQKLMQSKAELVKLNVALTQKIEERTGKLQTLMRLLCHDLKEPLARLSASTAHCPASESNIRNIFELISSVQDQNQFESLTRSMNIECIEPKNLIFRLRNGILNHLSHKDLQLVVQFENTSNAKILADEKVLVSHILPNLLSNAIKHSPVGGKIKIETKIEGDNLELSISDQGPGIPKQKLLEIQQSINHPHDESIFLEQGNSGVGLKLVAALLNAMNCKIRLETKNILYNLTDHGTTSTLVMPLLA